MSTPESLDLPAMPFHRRRGSLMVAVTIALFVFLAAHLGYASAQVAHANAQLAEYAHLQATYAAESAVWASLRSGANVPTTTLRGDCAGGADCVTYAATREIVDGPTWVNGSGTVVLAGHTYTVAVRGYVTGGMVAMWEFPP